MAVDYNQKYLYNCHVYDFSLNTSTLVGSSHPKVFGKKDVLKHFANFNSIQFQFNSAKKRVYNFKITTKQ